MDSGNKKRKLRGPYRRKFETNEDDNSSLTLLEDDTDVELKQVPDKDEPEILACSSAGGVSYDPLDEAIQSTSHLSTHTFEEATASVHEESKDDSEDDSEEIDQTIKGWIDSCFTDVDSLTMEYDDDDEDVFSLNDTLLDENLVLEEESEYFSEEATCTGKNQSQDLDDKELYPGSPVTLGAFMLLLAMFTNKFNLTGEGIELLLTLIGMVLPQSHNLCSTLYAFKKYFIALKNPLIKHYYCPACCLSVNDKKQDKCSNESCQRDLGLDRSYFLEIPVVNQIQNLFSQDGFYSKLQERFVYFNSTGIYRDIYDGNLYRSYFNNGGPLSSPDNISFLFNTDGAPVFKSSKISIWPIYLMINELPYKQRIKNENMILAGLWFDNKKPAMNTFLKPLLHSMEEMNKGVNCSSPDRGTFICKGYVLAGTADLPARSLLCNATQYNGAYSCWKCLQPGKTASVGKGHAHVFPFMADSPKGPPRTKSQVIKDAIKATDNQAQGKNPKVVNGVKGPVWLVCFPKFEIVSGIAIDYMHGLLLGVQKLLIRLWFDKSFSKMAFSIHKNVGEVDARLVSLLPSLSISRLPRTVQTHLKYWKASEFRSFLLYYGAPVIWGLLDSERFSHYLNLVNASHILLLNGSTEEDLKHAEKMLFSFCDNFSVFYDTKYMTLNIHQLVHLADSVRDLGPLYTHSCFSFEDKNGFVLKLIRGTQNIDSQIITGISFIQKLPELKQKCVLKGSHVEKLYLQILNSQGLKRGAQIQKSVYILGAVKEKTLTKEEFSLVCNFLQYCPTTDVFSCFNRIEFHGSLIYGLDYARMKKRNNSAIRYTSCGQVCFGLVKFFISLNQTEIVAVVQDVVCKCYNDKSFILSVNLLESCTVVSLNNIIESCMFLQILSTNQCYICLFPNKIECD